MNLYLVLNWLKRVLELSMIDLSILKYSVPNFIKDNEELMKKIKLIDFEEVNDKNKGNFSIFLKLKNKLR